MFNDYLYEEGAESTAAQFRKDSKIRENIQEYKRLIKENEDKIRELEKKYSSTKYTGDHKHYTEYDIKNMHQQINARRKNIENCREEIKKLKHELNQFRSKRIRESYLFETLLENPPF